MCVWRVESEVCWFGKGDCTPYSRRTGYHFRSIELVIAVYGPGEDPNHRSHWGFLIHGQGHEVGNLLHVQLISLEGLVYQFETKSGHPLESQTCEGRLFLHYIEASKYNQVVSTISREPAPRNNKVRAPLLMTGRMLKRCRIGVKTGPSNAL